MSLARRREPEIEPVKRPELKPRVYPKAPHSAEYISPPEWARMTEEERIDWAHVRKVPTADQLSAYLRARR